MKLLLLIPDGVGIRNFLYTDFLKVAKNKGVEVTIWANEDILSLVDGNYPNLVLSEEKPLSFFGEIFRKTWSVALIKRQASKFKNPNYNSYIFRHIPKKLIRKLIFLFEEVLILIANTDLLINKYRGIYLSKTRKTRYYDKCKEQLLNVQPDIVFSVIQRSSKAIAPLLAAKDLNIKNACFIYSWDNLPKATVFVESDHFFVWSKHMKNDFEKYYSNYIGKHNIHITGTPQFQPYFKDDLKDSRSCFAKQYNLPLNRKWICFSGDDITTSPNDQLYLRDVCIAVNEWNNTNSDKLHVIFRPCPVDFSNRYDEVLNYYYDLVTLIRPAWSPINPNVGWDKIVPRKEDVKLLVNTVLHSEFVVNLGSTMAHDFSIYDKPSIYLDYNFKNIDKWDVKKIYKFIHFETMEGLNAVLWASNSAEWQMYITNALNNSKKTVQDCKKWHKKVAEYPLELTNERIVNTLISL